MAADTEGKNKVNYVDQTGDVTHGTAPSWDYLYRVSSIRDPEWNPGDRTVLPDGREFIYARSTGNNALFAAHGCEFTDTGYISYTAFATNHAVGVSEITVPAATHAALTEDELRGGYIIIFDGATDLATTTRQIIGNDAADANALFKVRLDASITNAIVSGTEACEVFLNPYAALEVSSSAAKPKAGVPASFVSASQQYFWVIKKGFTWIAPQGTVIGNEGIGPYWRHDGSLDDVESVLGVTVDGNNTSQYAGHLVAGDYAGNGPLFNLQG